MKKILITGSSGFTGTFLLQYLSTSYTHEFEIFALYNSNEPKISNPYIHNIQVNLAEKSAIFNIILKIQPDIVIHFAGALKGELTFLMEMNLLCTQYLLDAIVESKICPRILITGSSAQYGDTGYELITENTNFAPLSMYGISKCSQEHLAWYYQRRFDLDITYTRTFNLFGPGQGTGMFLGLILKQLQY